MDSLVQVLKKTIDSYQSFQIIEPVKTSIGIEITEKITEYFLLSGEPSPKIIQLKFFGNQIISLMIDNEEIDIEN